MDILAQEQKRSGQKELTRTATGLGTWTWWWAGGRKAGEGTFRNVSSIYVTEFGAFKYNKDEWSETLCTIGGVPYGKWMFWHGNGDKWFEIAVNKDYEN